MYPFSSHNYFPEISIVCRVDRDFHTKLRGGGALIAVSEAVFFFALKVDPILYKLCSADYVKPNFTKLVVFFNRKI
jgi:hypothetical protein